MEVGVIKWELQDKKETRSHWRGARKSLRFEASCLFFKGLSPLKLTWTPLKHHRPLRGFTYVFPFHVCMRSFFFFMHLFFPCVIFRCGRVCEKDSKQQIVFTAFTMPPKHKQRIVFTAYTMQQKPWKSVWLKQPKEYLVRIFIYSGSFLPSFLPTRHTCSHLYLESFHIFRCSLWIFIFRTGIGEVVVSSLLQEQLNAKSTTGRDRYRFFHYSCRNKF